MKNLILCLFVAFGIQLNAQITDDKLNKIVDQLSLEEKVYLVVGTGMNIPGFSEPSNAPQTVVGMTQDKNNKRELLERFAVKKGWIITRIYSDIDSGLNDNRKNLLKLVKDLPTSGIKYVLCTYRDRMARFGNLLLDEFCKIFDTEIIEVQSKIESDEESLVQSIIAILYSFSGKLYRSRRGKVNLTHNVGGV